MQPTSPETVYRVIEKRSAWNIFDPQEIWRFRELFFIMVWRDIKIRYKQTFLGALWAIIQPVSQMLVFTIFFNRMAQMSSGGIEYPLFAMAGLLPWIFFSNSILQASLSIVSNQNLMTKIYFPRLFIPGSVVGVGALDFLIGCLVMFAMMIYYETTPNFTIIFVPVLILLFLLLTLGVGVFLAALTVKYRDFRYALPFIIQVWMFATPAIYMDDSAAGPRWQSVLPYNPAYGLIQCFRSIMLGTDLDIYSFGISSAMTIMIFLVGCYYFKNTERYFADIV